MSRQISYVKLHNTTFIPGIGAISDTLPSASKTLHLEMYEGAHGVELKVNGSEALIPWPMVQIVKFVPQAK